MSVVTPSRDLAQMIVNALRSGTVPPQGQEYYAVGLDAQMRALREQRDYVAQGRSAYKFIRGSYGSGKTFLTSLAASEALGARFMTSKVVVSVADTPLYRLTEIYRRLCQNATLPGIYGGALQSLVDRWLYAIEEQVLELEGMEEDDPGFPEAVAARVDQQLAGIGQRSGRLASALKAYHLAKFAGDFLQARGLMDWMAGEPKVGAGVKQAAALTGQLDNTDALVFLRGWLELLRSAGMNGLLVVLDEVETILRLRRPERLKSLEVLRQLVDALDAQEFPGLHLLITGTDDFFDSAQGVAMLQPLQERIFVDFADPRPDNLRQSQIRLPGFNRERLVQVARGVLDLYPADQPGRIRSRMTQERIAAMVDRVSNGFGGRIEVVPRIFLREFVHTLDLIDQHAEYDPATDYAFHSDRVADLSPEEEVALSLPLQTVEW